MQYPLFRRFLILSLGCFLICNHLHAQTLTPCDRVRILPAQKHEVDLVGGKITGSIVSPTEGYAVLAEITKAPEYGQWLEIKINKPQVCRWLRYEAPQGSKGWISKLEFYAGEEKLKGELIGSFPTNDWWAVIDPRKPAEAHSGHETGGQYVGLDIGDKGSCPRPNLNPGNGDYSSPTKVTLTCREPQASIYYTLDGTTPTPQNGKKYAGPIAIDRSTVLTAIATCTGMAPSPVNDSFYLFKSTPKRTIFYLGNSLTGNAVGRLSAFFKTGGFITECTGLGMGGGIAKTLWNSAMLEKGDPNDKAKWESLYRTEHSMGGIFTYPEAQVDEAKKNWARIWPPKTEIHDLTFQPRDADVAEEVDYEIRWLKFIREKFPNIQPWLYIEWDETNRQRDTDKALVPSYQMKTLHPALTWEESMSAMMLYGEEVQNELTKQYKEGKRPKILPVALAFGWIRNQIEHSQFPGVGTKDYVSFMHSDPVVHASPEGCYLIDLVWFSAMYGQSPEGKIWPWHLNLTPTQVKAMQTLAWDVVKNYPDCGLYEPGKIPVGKPVFTSAASPIAGNKLVTLASPTPGAWFRYTLDGTEPTRTRGYIYCGAITVPSRMTVKAVAYKSGMADSMVTSASY